MTDTKQLTALMIVYGNEAVQSAFRHAGVPHKTYQKLITSTAWRKAQKEAASAKLQQYKPPKAEKEELK
jgi:hypothetical protein